MEAEKAKELVSGGKYELSKHAEREREIDMIALEELERALKDCEIIEEYLDDPRGTSFLALGFYYERPVHAVCTIKAEPEELFLTTAYDPSKRPDKWTDNYRRRR